MQDRMSHVKDSLSHHFLFFALTWVILCYTTREDNSRYKSTWMPSILSVTAKGILAEIIAFATWSGALYLKLVDDEIFDKAAIHIFTMLTIVILFTGYNWLVKLCLLVFLLFLPLLLVNVLFIVLRSSKVLKPSTRFDHNRKKLPAARRPQLLRPQFPICTSNLQENSRKADPRINPTPVPKPNTPCSVAQPKVAQASQVKGVFTLGTEENQAKPLHVPSNQYQEPRLAAAVSNVQVPSNQYQEPRLAAAVSNVQDPFSHRPASGVETVASRSEIIGNQNAVPEKSTLTTKAKDVQSKAVQAGVLDVQSKAVQAGVPRISMIESSTSTINPLSPKNRKATRGTQVSPSFSKSSSSDWEVLEFKTRQGNIYKTVMHNKKLGISRSIDPADLYQQNAENP